jgi:hypothetical protein
MSWYSANPPINPRVWRATYEARGLALTGLSNPAPFHEPWVDVARWTANNANGTTALDAALVNTYGGAVKLDTSATAASRASLRSFAGAQSTWVINPTTEAWYCACRAIVDTTPTNVTVMAILGLLTVTGTSPVLGIAGATSTAFFALSPGSGAVVLSTVAIDTSPHTFEMFGLGTTTYYAAVDGESWISGTHGGSTVGPYAPYIQANNGAGASATQTFRSFENLYLARSS